MTDNQWEIICKFRKDFFEKVKQWQGMAPELQELQKKAVEMTKGPVYQFETSVVYNRALDEITKDDNIKLIVIGDNPGKDEQLAKNNKYLVGQAGKIAEGYFKKNSELCINFRKDVIILNKTPIHSGKTNQLKIIEKLGGEKIANLIKESQLWMAEHTAKLHIDLLNACEEDSGAKFGIIKPELWLVGYGELKDKGIFTDYRDMLKKSYENYRNCWDKVYVFQHFSMNRFSIDLANYVAENHLEYKKLLDNIHNLGEIHKKIIFNMN